MLLQRGSVLTDIEDLCAKSKTRCRFETASGCRLALAGVKTAGPCSECNCLKGATKEGPSRQVTPDTAASSGENCDLHEVSSDDDDEVDIISPTTRQTAFSHMSILGEQDDTLIILDWDDTLCPTSYIWSDHELHWDKPAPQSKLGSLRKHALAAEALLRLAAGLGTVCIVTLAQDPWVATSINNFLPDLQGLLEELDINVVYARNTLSRKEIRGIIDDELRDVSQALKTAAMRRVVGDGNWANAISVGDSDAEFYSIQDVTFQREGQCACKAVKLAEKPDLETLTAEMEVLLRWLPSIVDHSGDLELDFEDLGISPDSPSC